MSKNLLTRYKIVFKNWLLLIVCCVSLSALAATSEAKNKQLNGIDFSLDKDKSAVIAVELDASPDNTEVRRTPNGLSIELQNTTIPDEHLSILDVSDFATVIDNIEVFRYNNAGLIEVNINGNYRYHYHSSGNTLEVVVQQPKQDKHAELLATQNNQPISINFQDIPVRSVLQLIADYNDFNLVVSDSVSGNITLRLDSVPWQKALDIILESKGLDRRVDGSVILVAPKSELAKREQQQLA